MKHIDLISHLSEQENFAFIAKWDTIEVQSWESIVFSDNTLEELEAAQELCNSQINFILPFATARREKRWNAHGDEAILAFSVDFEKEFSREHIMKLLPEKESIKTTNITSSLSDEKYKGKVDLMKWEIQNGNICQWVLARCFDSRLEHNSMEEYLAIYKKLLQIPWWYMTYLAKYWDKIFAWASPEVHLRVKDNIAYKSPLAWTIMKWSHEDFWKDILAFLADKKESQELLMITDEELKMLTKICETWTIKGPSLKEIWKLIHGQYKFSGQLRNGLSPLSALRETLYSPTLVWWPIESAFTQIEKYEDTSRKYYGTAFWIVWEDFIDTTIPIRSAQIDANLGEIKVYAWAWITLWSDAQKEADETRKKAMWFFGILQDNSQDMQTRFMDTLPESEKKMIDEKLVERRDTISNYYLENQIWIDSVEELIWKKVSIIHNGDDFTSMIKNQLEDMWVIVSLTKSTQNASELLDTDVVLLWPGYGDINDSNNPKMVALLELTRELISTGRSVVWICLWHQAICKELGFEVVQQETITQWVQKEILLLWKKQNVWMYNSFAPRWDSRSINTCVKDTDWNILFLSHGNITSCQFHPESIMTENGYDILTDMLKSVL